MLNCRSLYVDVCMINDTYLRVNYLYVYIKTIIMLHLTPCRQNLLIQVVLKVQNLHTFLRWKSYVLHNVRVFAEVMFLVTPYKFFNNKYKQEICLLRCLDCMLKVIHAILWLVNNIIFCTVLWHTTFLVMRSNFHRSWGLKWSRGASFGQNCHEASLFSMLSLHFIT